MRNAELDGLIAELGVSESSRAVLDGIDDKTSAVLVDAVRAEQVRRDTELTSAIDNGLRAVPRLFRPVVKKILFG